MNYSIKEMPARTLPNIGLCRSFIASGPRGAVYGCLLYSDGRFRWLNLNHKRATSVPRDLARTSPLRLMEVVNG